ncbi:hypothetical protein HD553DRAFT_327220 [Filobasidium floriforme]|uniref:uncharacterized protein n=1 Tax=Filobasidium floriforme TaxID=5210 RepID=UPI001E8D8EB2|nr:uncharacterized protein HD553DRAFT_327220 [Filobasidium floriforme]KAH8077713.1 hypothetical protein HD553DRAFT_327220 [Filobasidium floriforme]
MSDFQAEPEANYWLDTGVDGITNDFQTDMHLSLGDWSEVSLVNASMMPVSGNGYQYGQQAHERSINSHYWAFGQQEHCSWGLDSEHAIYAFGGEMSLPSEGLTASFKPTYAYQDLSFHSDQWDMANVVMPQLDEHTFQQQSTHCKPHTEEPKKNAANCQSRSAQPSSQQCIVKRLDGAKLQDNNGNPVDGIVMPSFNGAAAYIGCCKATISNAMKHTDRRKGIVYGFWKIEEYNSILTEMTSEAMSSNEEQIRQESLGAIQLYNGATDLQEGGSVGDCAYQYTCNESLLPNSLGLNDPHDQDPSFWFDNMQDHLDAIDVYIAQSSGKATQADDCWKPPSAKDKKESRRRTGPVPKRCILKHKDDTLFQNQNGNLVSAMVMQSYKDVAAFVGCSACAVSSAMADSNATRGVLLEIWKVEDYTETEANRIMCLTVHNEGGSCLKQQAQPEALASEQNISHNNDPETNLYYINIKDITPSQSDEEMTFASSSVHQCRHQSVAPDWNSSAPYGSQSLSAGGRFSTGRTLMTQSSKMVMGYEEGSGGGTHTARSGYTQPDPIQTMLKGSARGKTLAMKLLPKTSQGGLAAKLYHVRRIDVQLFDIEGDWVFSAGIWGNKNVTKITGIGRTSLHSAELDVDIDRGEWKVTYLGKAQSSDHMNQELLRKIEALSTGSNWPVGLESNQPCQEYNGENTQVPSIYEDRLSTNNRYGVPATTDMNLLEHSLELAQPIDSAADFISSDTGGTIDTRTESEAHSKQRHSLSTRMKKSIRARNQRPMPDTARAKQSLNSASAKLVLVKRVDGNSFTYDKQQVDFAIISTISAASDFLGTSYVTLQRALRKRDRSKRVVRKIWEVEDLGKANPSA